MGLTKISTDGVKDNAVDTNAIANDAITRDKIADDVIASEHFIAGEVDTTALATNAVTTAKIADGTISTAKYSNSSITTEKIANDAITGAKLGDNAVATANIGDNQVTDAKISGMAASKLTGALPAISGANLTNLPSNTNTPAFSAGPAVAQSGLTDNNNYKVSFTEIMDSDGKFSNGNLFRPQVAGYYAYYASCYMRSADSSAVYGFYLTIRKGNSDQSNQGGTAWYQDNEGGDRLMTNISGVMYLSSSDYIEVWASANTYGSGSVNWEILSGFGSFGAYKLIGV